MIFTLCFMFTASAALFAASAPLALLLFGYIGGFTHYAASLFLFGKGSSGRVIGAAIALAILLQFLVQNFLVSGAALVASLFLSVCGILYLVMKPPGDWMFDNPLPYAAKPQAPAKSLLLPVCIVAVMSMCHGLGDGIITRLHAAGEVNLISYLRLFYALGALLAGAVSDMRGKRLLPLCTLCLLVLSSVMALFLGDGSATANGMYVGAVYLFAGFYVMYLTVTFLDVAPMTDKADLWAGMGRIVRGIFIGLTAGVSNALFESIRQRGMVIAGICLSLMALVLMAASGGLVIRPEKAKRPEDRLSAFLAKYRLTPREAEVLERLLGDGETNADIARELGISLRVLQRYVASIYEKAGVQTRVGLVKLYYNN